jgi:integrase
MASLKLQPSQLPDKTWRVNIPPWLSDKRKRERRFFPTRNAAVVFIEELKARRDNASLRLELSAPQLCQAQEAFALIGDRTDIRLPDAVAHYIGVLANRQYSITLAELFHQFTTTKSISRSKGYLSGVRGVQRRMSTLEDRLVCDITREDILPLFEGLSPITRNRCLVDLRSVLNWGIKSAYLKELPIRKADFLEYKPYQSVIVMPPGEVRCILEGTLCMMPELFPLIAVETFCGIRPAEAARLMWNDIDLLRGQVTIRATIAKTFSARVIKLMPCALAWFGAYIEAGHPHTGPLTKYTPITVSALYMRSLRRMLGYQASGEKAWKPGILRDTFASCHLAHHDSCERLTREMGHRSFTTTQDHYLGAVTKEEAAEFWNLFPSSGEKIVQLPIQTSV